MEPTALDTMYPTMPGNAPQATDLTEAPAGGLLDTMYPSIQKAETEAIGERKESQDTKAPDQGESKHEGGTPEQSEELTIPEGAAFNESDLGDFKSFAKELDLSPKAAQKALDYGNQIINQRVEAIHKPWYENQAKWTAQVKADPEIGGAKLQENVKVAQRIFQPGESNPFIKTAVEAKALSDALNYTGAGNNPAIVKLFVKIGNFMVRRGSSAGQAGDLAGKMYTMM